MEIQAVMREEDQSLATIGKVSQDLTQVCCGGGDRPPPPRQGAEHHSLSRKAVVLIRHISALGGYLL